MTDKAKNELAKSDGQTPAEVSDAPATSAVPGSNTTLTPVQKVQTDVIRYATKIWDKERATEFATRVALIARDNPQLHEAIKTNPDAFMVAYMASVSLDLMPNTPEGLAYIIPYGNKVQFQIGYKGLLRLARRSGEIKTINAELVFDGDHFRVKFGTERSIEHEPSFDVDRTDYSKVTHAYATAKLANGEDTFVVMSRKELDKIQATVKSSSTDTPWKQWPERQAIKTVLKRFAQILPSSTTDESLQKAVAMDSLAEAGRLRMDASGNIIEGQVINENSAEGRRSRMLAAEAKHKELNGGNHVPKPVGTDD